VHDAEKHIRMGFIRKVFAIFTVQLIVTFGCTLAFAVGGCRSCYCNPLNVSAAAASDGGGGHLFCEWQNPLKDYMRANEWVFYVSFGVSFAVLLAIICCQKNARSYPRNYILLSIFTLAESVMIGAIAAWYDSAHLYNIQCVARNMYTEN
jgi:FtsH-binding integral membrane protein